MTSAAVEAGAAGDSVTVEIEAERDGLASWGAQVRTIEREVKEMRRANEILELASAFFAQAELDRRLQS